MKEIAIIAAILVILGACAPGTKVATPTDQNNKTGQLSINDTLADDSLTYELIIFDVHFDTWMFAKARPMSFFTQAYLESWNAQLVREWNSYSIGMNRRGCGNLSYIDYDPNINYGMELNYRLFYYFRYMHERCRIFTQRPIEWSDW